MLNVKKKTSHYEKQRYIKTVCLIFGNVMFVYITIHELVMKDESKLVIL